MARKHGITTNTFKKFAIDSGQVYLNYGQAGETLLGATRGGNTFSIEQEIRTMEVDGARGGVVGDKRVVSVVPKIVANFVELSSTVLDLALPGATVANYGTPQTHYALSRALAIATGDYATNITIIGECSGSSTNYIECGITNALAEGNLELSFADKDEGVLTVTFAGHFSTSDLDTEPWFIRFPVIS